VPTPLTDHTPDLAMVREAVETVGRHLAPGRLIVLESTTYPGTTEAVVAPILESASGLAAGRDFALAYSPERIDPGQDLHPLEETPKIVASLPTTAATWRLRSTPRSSSSWSSSPRRETRRWRSSSRTPSGR
jgi:UDP-N-acetyl-D-glucosamine dehydrogenase